MGVNTMALRRPPSLARVGESAHAPRRDPGNMDLRHPSGLGSLEPGSRLDRFPDLADLEIELGTGAAATIPGGGDGVAGGDLLAGRLVEALVVPVEAQIPIAVIHDGQKSQARKPVGVDHPSLADRL